MTKLARTGDMTPVEVGLSPDLKRHIQMGLAAFLEVGATLAQIQEDHRLAGQLTETLAERTRLMESFLADVDSEPATAPPAVVVAIVRDVTRSAMWDRLQDALTQTHQAAGRCMVGLAAQLGVSVDDLEAWGPRDWDRLVEGATARGAGLEAAHV